MYARKVSMNLKPNSVPEFTQRLDKEVIPLLRKQHGFQDEMTFVAPRGTEAFGISLWDKAANAEAIRKWRRYWREWLRERLKWKPMKLPTRPSTRSPLASQSKTGKSFGSVGRAKSA